MRASLAIYSQPVKARFYAPCSAMPPACAPLDMAMTPPSRNQHPHFLKLPVKIRYRIYERLRDGTLPVTIHDFEGPDCISGRYPLALD